MDLVGEIEQHGDRLRGVEVVVHRAAKSCEPLLVRLDAASIEPPQRGIQPSDRGIGLPQMVLGVVEWTAVVARQHEESDRLGGIVFQHTAQREEIAERLRHLLVVDAHEAVVHPHVHELASGRRLALRDLVLVVGKLEVHPPAVDVEMLSEAGGRHRGAFDVPAGPARSPRRIPARLAGLRRLPQHEVERVVLGLVDLDPRTAAQILGPAIRQRSVGRERAHVVVDVAVCAPVRGAVADQALHHRDDGLDVRGGARLHVGVEHAERAAVFMHELDESPRERAEILAVLVRTGDDLVVDVGDVAHVRHAVADGAQVTGDHVERHEHPGVTDMTVVVHGHAAHVHPYVPGLDGTELLLRARQRVVDLQHGRRPNRLGGGDRGRCFSTSVARMP